MRDGIFATTAAAARRRRRRSLNSFFIYRFYSTQQAPLITRIGRSSLSLNYGLIYWIKISLTPSF